MIDMFDGSNRVWHVNTIIELEACKYDRRVKFNLKKIERSIISRWHESHISVKNDTKLYKTNTFSLQQKEKPNKIKKLLRDQKIQNYNIII